MWKRRHGKVWTRRLYRATKIANNIESLLGGPKTAARRMGNLAKGRILGKIGFFRLLFRW